MEAADRAVNRHYARPTVLRRIERLLTADDLDPLTCRRLSRLQREYRAKQAPIDVLDRIIRRPVTAHSS